MQQLTSPQDDPAIDKGLWGTLGTMISLGVAMVLMFAIGSAPTIAKFFSGLSTGMLIGGAFFTAGGLTGFLFGIPKLLQNTSVSPKTVILHNDNLVQISDWLTKIIVGVGLTQLYNIPHYLLKVGEKLQKNFGDNESGRNAAIAVILYFVVIGFLSVYIWTRIYFVRLLKDLNEELDPITDLKQKIEEQDYKLKLTEINSKIEQFERLRTQIVNFENNFDGLKDIFKVVKPGQIKWFDDSQKDRWGGKSEVDGITLEAEFVHKEDITDPEPYTVILSVRGSPTHPLVGKVYFFLHDSYMPYHIRVVEAIHNVASTSVESYEAFTVGAIAEDGKIVLELDLNKYEKTPDDYIYTDPLTSIDQLLEQKALILEKMK